MAKQPLNILISGMITIMIVIMKRWWCCSNGDDDGNRDNHNCEMMMLMMIMIKTIMAMVMIMISIVWITLMILVMIFSLWSTVWHQSCPLGYTQNIHICFLCLNRSTHYIYCKVYCKEYIDVTHTQMTYFNPLSAQNRFSIFSRSAKNFRPWRVIINKKL